VFYRFRRSPTYSSGIAIDSSTAGNVYVSDFSENDRIQGLAAMANSFNGLGAPVDIVADLTVKVYIINQNTGGREP
jgi:fucose permease